MPLSTMTKLSVLAVAVFCVYVPWLERSPIYLHDAEVQFGLHAQSIASTLHDTNGRLLPLYFQMPAIGGNVWFHPMLVYLTAPFLTILPFSETSVRLPAVFIGVADVLLIYFVARRVFKRETSAFIAAVLLALTPAHFIHSRVAMDYLYPVPFILAWLLCLVTYLDTRRPWLILAGAVCLGLGFYSYIASVIMMPLYFAMTLAVLFIEHRKLERVHMLAAIGFVLPLLLAIPWFLQHSTVYTETVERYGIYSASRLNPLQGLKDFLNYNNVQERLSLYWDFYNPAYLFFAGGSNLINSTRRAGVFLLPIALFLPVGIYQLTTRRRSSVSLLVLAGFASAPFAALFVDERYAVDRELGLLPFAVLIAVAGVDHLLAASNRVWRALAIVAIAALPLQFAYFYHDYFTDYRIRSSPWFELNIRGAVDQILARADEEPVPTVYLSTAIPYVALYWKFYLIKHHRLELLDRAVPFDLSTVNVDTAPVRSLILTLVSDDVAKSLARSGSVKQIAVITEPDGAPAFAIFERSSP
jgi:4-amino-4-deoxy-L-arabinose transferase-like glycosyltransferase